MKKENLREIGEKNVAHNDANEESCFAGGYLLASLGLTFLKTKD
jgi:hypothetical protein